MGYVITVVVAPAAAGIVRVVTLVVRPVWIAVLLLRTRVDDVRLWSESTKVTQVATNTEVVTVLVKETEDHVSSEAGDKLTEQWSGHADRVAEAGHEEFDDVPDELEEHIVVVRVDGVAAPATRVVNVEVVQTFARFCKADEEDGEDDEDEDEDEELLDDIDDEELLGDIDDEELLDDVVVEVVEELLYSGPGLRISEQFREDVRNTSVLDVAPRASSANSAHARLIRGIMLAIL